MSLALLAARRSAFALRRAAPTAVSSRRSASTHDEHHHDDGHGHHEHVDTNVYPREGFSAPIWRNVVILSVVGVAIAYYLPDNWREDNIFLREWRARGYTDPQVWVDRNNKHLEQSVEVARHKLVREITWRPIKKEWGFQGYTDQLAGSPHCIPVGAHVDMTTPPAKTS